jgi:hypothetical protein
MAAVPSEGGVVEHPGRVVSGYDVPEGHSAVKLDSGATILCEFGGIREVDRWGIDHETMEPVPMGRIPCSGRGGGGAIAPVEEGAHFEVARGEVVRCVACGEEGPRGGDPEGPIGDAFYEVRKRPGEMRLNAVWIHLRCVDAEWAENTGLPEWKQPDVVVLTAEDVEQLVRRHLADVEDQVRNLRGRLGRLERKINPPLGPSS